MMKSGANGLVTMAFSAVAAYLGAAEDYYVPWEARANVEY